MKLAVSISIGSSKRDKTVEVDLLGEKVRLERRGTDGDMEAAAQLYRELDGKADAFGVGGAVLGLMIDKDWYTLQSVQSLVRYVTQTPVGDGTGLKMTLERKLANVIEEKIGDSSFSKKVLLMSAVDRYGMFRSFWDKGYECVIGDMMFTLGVPVRLYSDKSLKRLARTLVPVMGHLPFHWLYPTGESQEERTPKFEKDFKWASVVAGDCHYITKYMPDDMEGKIVVTNTTTVEDRELFKKCGVKYLITTTPMMDGRTFGTNMLEAGIVAAMGRKEKIDYNHPESLYRDMDAAIEKLGLSPQFQEL